MRNFQSKIRVSRGILVKTGEFRMLEFLPWLVVDCFLLFASLDYHQTTMYRWAEETGQELGRILMKYSSKVLNINFHQFAHDTCKIFQ